MFVSVSRSRDFAPSAHKYFTIYRISDVASFAKIITEDIWSPIIWRDDTRLRDNFLSCKYAALDFDDGQWTLETAERWLRDQKLSGIIGTSKSHQKPKKTAAGVEKGPCDRFRLVVPFRAEITEKATYEFNMRRLCGLMPCDSACVDAARYFYPCTAVTYSQFVPDGSLGVALPTVTPLSKGEEAAAEARKIQRLRGMRAARMLPSWAVNVLRAGVPGTVSRHKICFRLGANLIHAGYSEAEIVELILASPLAAIGAADVERAVANGASKSLSQLPGHQCPPDVNQETGQR